MAKKGLAKGTEAPPFRLRDSRGEEISLAEYQGRKLMLIFSSSRCKYCQQMYPELKRLESHAEANGAEVVMLQLGSTPEQNQELVQAHEFSFPVLAADQEIFVAYQVPGTPFSTVIDERGRVASSGLANNFDLMADLLGSAVAELR